MLTLTWTRMSGHITCQRKDYYTYERNLKPLKGSTALRYGSVWHKCLEYFYLHIKENGWTRDGQAIEAGVAAAKKLWEEYEANPQEYYPDYRTLENINLSFLRYIDHFSYDEGMLQILQPERRFELTMPVSSDHSLPAMEPFVFAGTLDMEVLLNGRPWLWENKTTGQALSQQVQRLHRSGQFMGYTFAGTEEAKTSKTEAPDGMLVIFHHLSCYKSKKTGLYGKPKIDFQRVPQIFSEADLRSWKTTLYSVANSIMHQQEVQIWPMAHPNCHQFGRCAYTDLCEQNAPLGEENTYGFYYFEEKDRYKA